MVGGLEEEHAASSVNRRDGEKDADLQGCGTDAERLAITPTDVSSSVASVPAVRAAGYAAGELLETQPGDRRREAPEVSTSRPSRYPPSAVWTTVGP